MSQMNNKSFLVSFCNNKNNDGSRGLLGKLDYDTHNNTLSYSSIELSLPKGMIAKGITGMCWHNGGIVALLQSTVPQLLFLSPELELLDTWALNGLKGVHSILSRNEEIYFAITGQDNIQKTADGINFDVVWETDSNIDTIHLNSICFHQNELYFTAFGHKDGLWSSAKSGVVQAAATNQKLRNDIWHPHSVFSYQDDLVFCNSSNQRVESINGLLFDQLPGYSRGLYISDELMVCGTSKGRLISHSTGVRISNISDQGVLAGNCGIWVYDRINDTCNFINLDEHATEVFDIIKLKT